MSSRGLAIFCLAFGAALFASGERARPARAVGAQTWLVASDIHLNPYDRSHDPSQPGSDTNRALFASAVAEMKRDVPDPAVVLLPGDFLAHDFPALVRRYDPNASADAAALKTMALVETAFARAYPRAQFAIALGNNDAPCGDYRADVDDAYLAAVARIWAPLIERGGAAPDFVRDFSRGGYYTAALPVEGLRLVVLNTILFSSEFRGVCGGGQGDASTDELRWIDATLRAGAAGTRNVVMMHIPPGYDAFSTEVAKGFVAWSFLNESANDALVASLTAPSSRVAYAFAAHTHRFDFRLLGNVPAIVFGSISPVYRGNPSFYGVRIGSDGSVRDIDVYAYDEWTQAWTAARSFDLKWNVERVDWPALSRLHQRLAIDPSLRRTWDVASSGWPSNPSIMWPMWGDTWRVPWCAQTVLQSSFAACAGLERQAMLARLLVAAAIGVAIGVAALLVRFALLAARRRAGAARPS